MVAIPQELYDKYNAMVSDMINLNFGVYCLLQYPPLLEDCPNCIFDSLSRKSSNRYQSGGPQPFSFGVCPWCNGDGTISRTTANTTIKLRVYYQRKDWIKLDIPLDVPDGYVQVIGHMYDLDNFMRAQSVILNSDLRSQHEWKFVRAGQPVPHGLGEKRFFVAFMKGV